jgi:c-di-GMP-related signal transduction protein
VLLSKSRDTVCLQPGCEELICENRYLFRSPLLDLKQQVMGYRLAWQKTGHGGLDAGDDAACLLTAVSEGVRDIKIGMLFLDVTVPELSPELLQLLPPQTTVFIVDGPAVAEADLLALVAPLREQGFGLALRNVDLAFLKAHAALLAHVTHVLVGFDHPELAEISVYARLRPGAFLLIADDIPGWPEFEQCVALGACGFFGNLCVAPRQIERPAKLAPQAQQILQLMQMVQGNADIRHLEKVLKSDVTLSYKLLRYINSAGFGLEVDIESPRHAVAMLGYAPLFRWLLLLLARTNTTGFSPALMQAAMVRGRFAELLGHGFLSRREAENLFVVGMFSFLDRLLGIPIQEVLGQLVLPDAVAQALASRDGLYGPVLALAEASEREDGGVAALAETLSMTTAHVNHAHLSAIGWAQGIKL